MNRLKTILFILIVCSSCAGNKYILPRIDDFQTNPYGAHIKVSTDQYGLVIGELLAVEGDTLIINDIRDTVLVFVDRQDILGYRIQFCRYKR